MDIQAIRTSLWPGSTAVHDRILSKLFSTIGQERAQALLRYFHQSARGITCKYYDAISGVAYKYVRNPAQRVSPIIIGSLADLSFYEITGIPYFSQEKRTMFFLEKYLLIPTSSGKLVFISDDHTHAAFAWHLAADARIIKDDSALFHADKHNDNAALAEYKRGLFKSTLSKLGNRLLKAAANLIWTHIEIFDFIAFASDRHENPFGKIICPSSIYFIKPENIGKDIKQKTVFSSPHNPNDGIDGVLLSLEHLIEKMHFERANGKTVVLDIDLDFFTRFLPGGSGFTPDRASQLETVLQTLIEAARLADFITIATSPNYLLVEDQPQQIRYLLNRIVSALDT